MLSGRTYWQAFADHLERGASGIIFVECIDCPSRTEQQYETLDAVTDAEAEAYFRALGWTIKPTRCPACVSKAQQPSQ
jgi:hypothetical protein